jgi:hypothetical protein
MRRTYLAFTAHLTQLPAQLGALSEASGAERMSLRDETTARVHHPPATVGGIPSVDQLSSLSRGTQTERLVSDQLYGEGEDDTHTRKDRGA